MAPYHSNPEAGGLAKRCLPAISVRDLMALGNVVKNHWGAIGQDDGSGTRTAKHGQQAGRLAGWQHVYYRRAEAMQGQTATQIGLQASLIRFSDL